jgi:chromosome segregation ATPase
MGASKLIGITIVLCAVIVIVTTANAGNTVQSQEVRMLETRINQLEQRLYSIESNINRIQQSAYLQRSGPSSTSDQDMHLIREQLQNLTLRVSETECGLLKLDERTATSRRGTAANDPCRANPAAPLRLPSRP